MKKIIGITILIIILGISMFAFTGCTLKVETSDNSVSASVDGETSDTIDNVFTWIKERINRVFNTDDNTNQEAEQKETGIA